jgi:Leucine-rich repeat (LRR) protein
VYRFAAITVVGLIVTAGAGEAKRPKPTPCPPARYVIVEGAPLVDDVVVAGADAIAVAPSELTIAGNCTAVPSTKATRKSTRVRARWDSCGTLTKLKLGAKIAAPSCSEMRGTLKAKKAKPHRFRAVLSTCGDGHFDAGGETCDAGEGCGAGEQCTAACTCDVGTAAGIVTLPTGVAVAPADLSVMSGAGTVPVDAGGGFTVAVLTHASTQVELVTSDGKIVMLGFVDPRPGATPAEISATSTARVLLYYALAAFLLPPEHHETVLTLIAERPEVAALAATIAARIAANPTALQDGDAEIANALVAAQQAILAPVLPPPPVSSGRIPLPGAPPGAAAGATDATLVLIDPPADVVQSGVQILQNPGGTGIIAQNTFRRPGGFLLYQVGWEDLAGTAHEIDPPQQIGGVNEIPSTRQLNLLHAITDALTGAAPFAPIASAPVDLPLVPGSRSTRYEVVVLGPTLDVVSVPPLFLDPRFFPFRQDWDGEIDTLAMRSFWADFVGPTMSFLFMGSAATISGTQLRALEAEFVEGFGPAMAARGLSQPLTQVVDSVVFLADLVSGAGEFTKMANLVNGILVDDAINTAKYEAIRTRLGILTKSAAVLAAVDAALTAFDIGAVIKDLQSSSKGERWEVNAIQAPVRLTPASATVTKNEPAVTLTASVTGFPTSTFLYRYTTTGAHGTVCPIIGDCATAVDSTFDEVQYVADPATIVDGDLDTVTVEVFEDSGPGTIPPGATPIGTATSRIRGEIGCADPEAVVDVPSVELRQTLRQNLGVPAEADLTCADMERLTSLGISGGNIETLEGLQFATNLTFFSCHFCLLTEVPQLSRLRRLTSLSLTQNGIVDLTPLTELTALTSLDLYWNRIADVSPLAGLTGLTFLNLWRNELTSVSALAGLTQLRELNLRENQIASVSALAGLVEMRTLTLSFNQLTTLGGLQAMTALEHLAVDYNEIDDIGALSDLDALVFLDAEINYIEDIQPLDGTFALRTLNLYGNLIADLGTVDWAGMPIERLDLGYNALTSIGPLQDLFAVSELDVSYNRISDATPVGGMVELVQLGMRNNLLSDIQPLVDNTGLGAGDVVNIQENCLGTGDADIQTLLGRGVSVYYEPQGCTP